MPEQALVADILGQELSKEASQLARKAAEDSESIEHKLLSLEAHAKRIEHELSQYMLIAKKRISDGFWSCIDATKELARLDSTINLESLESDVRIAFSRFDSVARVKDMSGKTVEGMTWKELLGLSDATLQLFYQAAKSLFDCGQHPKAEAAFFFLTTVDYKQYAFWLGLGHAAFHVGNLNQAINAYEMADSCQPGSIYPSLYVANCFEALNDYQEALLALEKADTDYKSQDTKDPELEHAIRERIMRAKLKA